MSLIRILLMSMLALLAGCALSLNRLPPYSQYVGQTLALKEPMVLIRNSEPTAYSHTELVHPDEVEGDQVSESWKVLKQVPAGTLIVVKKVRWIRTNNSGGWILAVCRFPRDNDDLHGHIFTYYWGDETLNRAPWEDPSTPPSRYVGSHGREFSK